MTLDAKQLVEGTLEPDAGRVKQGGAGASSRSPGRVRSDYRTFQDAFDNQAPSAWHADLFRLIRESLN